MAERRAIRTEQNSDDLLENALEEFLRRHVAKLKSARHVERLLRVELRPWRGRRIQEIVKRDVIKLIDGVHDRGAPTTARRTARQSQAIFLVAN